VHIMLRNFAQYQPKIAVSAYVDELALVIGQVEIDEQASIFPMAVLRGDIQRIVVGARTNIQDGSILHVTHDSQYCTGGLPLLLSHDITIGHNATLHACNIGHHCLIGMGAIVLDGAVLEPYTMLAAGSLVAPHKKLEGGFLWRGSPAVKVRSLTAEEKTYLHYSAQNYVTLAGKYRSLS
jgi:carbonic anhydrase/acetyltransferase-like protein (isoleucine patch superfamily)